MTQSKDIVLKNFWKDNGRFADVFNGALFHGQTVLSPEHLKECDSDVSQVIRSKGHSSSYKRNRDVIKKMYQGAQFIIFGLENQSYIDYAMPLRIMGYDFLNYTKEFNLLKRKHKREKSENPMTEDEFLSGIFKTDRLHPVFTLVIYYGKQAWDGPRSLKDMMAPLPPALKHCFSDYSMNLTCITDEPPQNFSHPDVYALFEITQMICRKDQKGLQEKYSHIGIEQDVFDAVKSITALDIKPVPDSKGGKVKMWTSVNEWQQEIYKSGEEKGYKSGERDGYKSGERDGYKSGQEAARRELIAHMLENHWDADTIHQATAIPLGEIREVAQELQH